MFDKGLLAQMHPNKMKKNGRMSRWVSRRKVAEVMIIG